MPTKKKNKTLNNEDKKLIEEIIRVDHAGEHGATQIYRGQLAVFKENTEFGKEIKEMADQEEIHKATFDEYIVKENVKPTALFPFWNLAGYALGLGTALMGKKQQWHVQLLSKRLLVNIMMSKQRNSLKEK